MALILSCCFALLTATRSSGDSLVHLVLRFGDLYSQGRLSEARSTAREILRELEGTGPALNLDRAVGLNNLAALAGAEGDWKAAEPLFRQALEIAEKVAGADHPATATLLYNLGGLEVERGRFDRAETLYERSLAIWEKTDDLAQPAAPETLNNLGFLKLRRGNPEDAGRLLQRALSLWERDKESPLAAVALTNLALLEAMRGRFTEAEALYRRALVTEQEAFGSEHPEPATTLNNLAFLYRRQGRLNEAAAMHRRALSLLENSLGPDDPLSRETAGHLRELEATAGGDSGASFQLILLRSQPEAKRLHARVEQGEDFGELARQHSLDPSAPGGGYVRMDPSDLREELRLALERLGPGELSPPFEAGSLWAIVKKSSRARN
jgi:tetratricopeptide (TPR) repeat protein